MNAFINFHLACLTKEALMNALSIAPLSLFPWQEWSRTLGYESKPCLSSVSLARGMLRHGCGVHWL